MATIERRQRGGRRSPVRWRVRWRDADGRSRNKTFEREDEARRFKVRLDGDMAAGTWIDPALARVSVREWTSEWRKSVVDLRPSTLARLDSTVSTHVLPEWGGVALSGVTNADVRAGAARLHREGLSASSVRKSVFALRRILAAAVADRRLSHNAADNVPMPVDEPGEQRYLTARKVTQLADTIAPRFRAMVLIAAYGGLRFGELAALRRERIDVLRSRRLRTICVPTMTGRRAALLDLAAKLPAAVLADLPCLHPTTAVNWANNAAGDWNTYAAALVKDRTSTV